MPKMQVSYSHPRMFSFRLNTAQQNRPIPDRTFLYIEDGSTVIFTGHVWEIKPVDANVVDYICYAPDMRARNEITVMSGPDTNANIIPRRVYNAKMVNDDDYLFEYAHDQNVGGMIVDILNDHYNELLAMDAAPLGGGGVGTAPPYYYSGGIATDVSSMSYIPQDKVVFESELLGSALDRLLTFYPAYRVLFTPSIAGTVNNNVWRFINVPACSATTLSLNDFTSSHPVMSLGLSREFTNCYTAIEIYGPQQLETDIVYSSSDSASISATGSALSNSSAIWHGLVKQWTSAEATTFGISGPGAAGTGLTGLQWQIKDPNKRLISPVVIGSANLPGVPLTPQGMQLPDSQLNSTAVSVTIRLTNTPTFQVTWDGTTWYTVPGVTIDRKNGIITTPYPIYKYQQGGSPVYLLPSNARFLFSYFGSPLVARAPGLASASQYKGTAAGIGGMDATLKLYDEMFSLGYLQGGTPYTTPERMAQYEALAQSLLSARENIRYTGGCVLDGIDYTWVNLQACVNFNAYGNSGTIITTGWENIYAMVTDVEYDYEGQITTLTFSSDLLQYKQMNIDTLRKELGIKAYQVQRIIAQNMTEAANGSLSNTVSYQYQLIDMSEGYAQVAGTVMPQ